MDIVSKSKFFEVTTYIPIYSGWLLLSMSNNFVDARLKHNKEFGVCEDDIENLRTYGALLVSKQNNYGLFLEKTCGNGLLSHEIHHLATRVLERAGLEFSNTSEEAYTYLDSWLTDWIYYQLDKHQIKIKAKHPDRDLKIEPYKLI